MLRNAGLLFVVILLAGCQTFTQDAATTSAEGVITDEQLLESEEVVSAAAEEHLGNAKRPKISTPEDEQSTVAADLAAGELDPADINDAWLMTAWLAGDLDDTDCGDGSCDNAEPAHPDFSQAEFWQRMRRGYSLDLSVENPRIRAERAWFMTHQAYIDRTFTRSQRYYFHILGETERRKIPTEIALLPVVESAFNPFAYSHARASGMWQFIPSTGVLFGLEQNWWYDGRRDVVASTDGALRLMQRLADRFDGDWLLALAAYNSGAGTVSKAIKYNQARGLPTDFWSLKLPRETEAYVPKLIAIAQIVKEPSKYGVTLVNVENKPYFDIVNTGGQIDLAQAAELAGITLDELYLLNPGYNRWATPPTGPHRLLVPVENGARLRAGLSKLSPEQRVSWGDYRVQGGDTLSAIAKRFRTTPSVIQEVNRLKSSRIREGQVLLIPSAGKDPSFYSLSAPNRVQARQQASIGSAGSSRIEHIVRKGDTLWDIARKYRVNVRTLAKWNAMAPSDPLVPGKKLVIWSKVADAKPVLTADISDARPMVKKISYKVRSGDSLSRIASKYNVGVKDIVAWNQISKSQYLRPGQHLVIYVDIRSVH